MIIHNLKQGSKEWLEFRLTKLTASEACVAKGISSYMGRTALLEAKKVGKYPEVTKAEQHLYDLGHKAEATARSIAEEILACDLYPVTASLDVEGLPLSASFDGLTLENDIVWEHKLSNQTLRANLELDIIPEEYKYQLEQQLLVSGATKALFMASDGTKDNCMYTMYESEPEIRSKLIDGWKQFQNDLEGYTPKERVEVLIGHKTNLPVVTYSVTGTEISTNLSDCIDKVRDLANTEMNKVLETDQDFANKDQLNKDIKKARASLKEIVANVDSQFQTRQIFAESAKEMDGILQKMLSHGEKQVKQAKEAKKADIANKAGDELLNHAQQWDKRFNPEISEDNMIFTIKNLKLYPYESWFDLMKGKHKIESIQNAVDTRLAELKIDMDKDAQICDENITYYREVSEGYGALFNDLLEIVKHPYEAFKALVDSRIANHIREQEIRLYNERKRIREEEERKALAKAEEERQRIRQEEEQKAREELNAKMEEERKQEEARIQAKLERAAQEDEETSRSMAEEINNINSDPVEFANDIAPQPKLNLNSMSESSIIVNGVECGTVEHVTYSKDDETDKSFDADDAIGENVKESNFSEILSLAADQHPGHFGRTVSEDKEDKKHLSSYYHGISESLKKSLGDIMEQAPELNNTPPKTELKASISEQYEYESLNQYFDHEELGKLRHDEHGNEFMLEVIVKRSYLKY